MTYIKQTILSIVLLMGLASTPAFAEAQLKEVCKDTVGKDGKPIKNKDGSVKQTCKKIKVHKKLEGTEVPVKK